MPVEAVNLGCRLNGAETETMRRRAEAAGFHDLTVVNTCAVTAEAARRSGQAVRRAARASPGRLVVATGCAAEIEPGRFTAIPGVTVLPQAAKTDPRAWARLRDGLLWDHSPRHAEEPLGHGPGASRSTHHGRASFETHASRAPQDDETSGIAGVSQSHEAASDASAGRVRSFIAVQTGCDHDCTFCTIPRGRGRSRSVPAAAVIAAIREAVTLGTREAVLTGVDLTAYGLDLTGEPGLGRLVTAVLRAVPELPRLRLSSIDSVEADPALLDALATEPRLMPHLHLSLQAGDDLILTRMKRRHRRADAIALCAELRRLRPDIVFGADLIAGFPTETEQMFARSLDLVAECGLTYLHVFPFSPRPGTPAARMPQLAPAVAAERAARLRQAGGTALAAYLDREIGKRRAVLIESPGLGRTEGFAPVRIEGAAERGELREVRIVRREGAELIGV